MTDLEMIRLCAEAMGYYGIRIADRRGRNADRGLVWVARHEDGEQVIYQPLHDDAHAMALVKKFGLSIQHVMHDNHKDRPWRMFVPGTRSAVIESDLNRAIVECVAKMQKAKNERS